MNAKWTRVPLFGLARYSRHSSGDGGAKNILWPFSAIAESSRYGLSEDPGVAAEAPLIFAIAQAKRLA
jgi:hypothetical protein